MNYVSLMWTSTFIVIAMLLSIRQRLGLEKDILISAVRAAVQLLAVGYVLQFVFQTNHPALVVCIIGVMITVAAWNAGRRANGRRGFRRRIAFTIAFTEAVTIGLLLVLGIISPEPRYLIPISGMVIGSSMVVCGLYLHALNRELSASRGEIETLLALGASERQAIHRVLKTCVKASMIPTIDGMKTVGLVQLPGMMTGMIVAGASPVEAVRYQILIMFSFTAAAAVTSILFGVISYRLLFARDGRLVAG